jgi:hypothetical protein
MIKKTATALSSLLIIGMGIVVYGPACDYIPNNSAITDTTLVYFEKNAIYRVENFHIFDATIFGASTDFSGTRACSVWVNSALDSAAEDSLYGRIHYDKDTVVRVNDSILGAPKFYVEDIVNWKTVGYHFTQASYSFLGKLFKKGMDSSLFLAIQKCLDTIKTPTTRPPEAFVKEILSVLNTAVSDVEFFLKNRDTLMLGVDRFVFDPRINRLINESIFVDSTGQPKPGLTVYEKTMILWFNMEMLTSPSIDFIPVDIASKMFPLFLTCSRIHKFVFQQGPRADSMNERIAVRLFSFNKNGEAQVAWHERYSDSVEMDIDQINEKKLLPFPYCSSTNWSVTPFFWSKVPVIPYEKNMGMIQIGRAMSQYNKGLSSFARAYFDLTLMYPINGAIVENSGSTNFIGSIVVTFSYWRSLFFPFNPGTITDWNTHITVRKTDAKGKTTIRKESYLLTRMSL